MPLTDADRNALLSQQGPLQEKINAIRQELNKHYQLMMALAGDIASVPETVFFTGTPSGVDADDPEVTRKIVYVWSDLANTLDLAQIAKLIADLRTLTDQLGDINKKLAVG